MKAARRALGFCLSVVFPLACAVYQDDILPSELVDEVAGAANSAGSAGTLGVGATSSNGGSSSATAGTTAGGVAGSSGAAIDGNAGETGADAGESSGGEGGEPTSGGMTNGGGGAGGKAGAGGKGGAGAGGAGGKGGAGAGGNGGAGQAGGGNGGSGGKPTSGPLCSDHPLTARTTWIPTASHAGVGKDLVTSLTDNKVTRWATNRAQMGDEWIQVDFGATVTLTHINLQQAQENMNDYPRQYAVIVSDKANDLTGTVRLSGAGVAGVSTAIALPNLASGRYLLLKQLGTSLSWWSIVELEVSCVDKN